MSARGAVVLPGWGTGAALLAGLVPEPGTSVIAPDWARAGSADELVPLALEAAHRAVGERLVVLGWSLGAMVALEALPAFPPRVAELRLVAPCLRFTAAWPARVLERMSHRCRDDAGAVLEAFLARLFAPGEAAPGAVLPGRWPAAALQAGLAFLAGRALTPPAPRRGCAVRVVHGGADPVIPAPLSLPVAQALGAERLVLPGAGHAPHLTRPAESAAFLRGEGRR